MLDVGGSETTQRRSASLYDKILSNPKIELTSEGTIKLENSDADIPLSTFLYRLQNPFPKSRHSLLCRKYKATEKTCLLRCFIPENFPETNH